MEPNELSVNILNDLIRINNDRIAGYQRAINETKDLDIDLKATFNNMIGESEKYRSELADLVTRYGGTVPKDNTLAGKIYRVWMDLKATFTGADRRAILENCEYGEDAAQRVYEESLSRREELTAEAAALIEDQQRSLKLSHDLIKKYRDAHEALK